MKSGRSKHEDTTIKIDAVVETALKKAMDAGPYPKEAPESRPSRSAQRTKPTRPSACPKSSVKRSW
jgi:hypothetical protein